MEVSKSIVGLKRPQKKETEVSKTIRPLFTTLKFQNILKVVNQILGLNELFTDVHNSALDFS